MVEGRFFIGKEKKHEIYVSYSLWTGQLKVDIDGKKSHRHVSFMYYKNPQL